MKLNKMCKEIYEGNKAKGFWDKERNLGELLMFIVSELGEAIEAHRKGNTLKTKRELGVSNSMIDFLMNKKNYKAENWRQFYEMELKDSFETEIGDTFIRLMDLCGGLNIDIDKFIEMKMEYNKGRGKLHGKAY